MIPAVEIHLHVRVSADNAHTFFAFLRDAIPFYEQPGGIRMKILQNNADPLHFIEVVQYTAVEDYERDQHRIEHDAEMKQFLSQWRSLLAEPPTVQIYSNRDADARANG